MREPRTGFVPRVWHRDHRIGLAGIVAATALVLVAGFLGPSVVTLTLGPRKSLLPPWYLPHGVVVPNEWVVSALVWASIIVGGFGLWFAMRALRDGWRPAWKRLFALGTALSLLTITVPPLTSADVLMYAAYGRLQVLKIDPYTITPAEIFRSQYDPVLHWTERPWQDTPSVYGPILSWSQLAANKLGGTNMHDIVFWLQVCAVVPFIVMSLLVVMLAHGDAGRQARAALFTIANPLLIWAVVAGAHNEAMSVMFAVAAMLMVRKTPFGAGIGIGLAGCAKISIGIWGIAMLWAYRREPKKAALLCLGTLVPMGLAYGLWKPTAFFQAIRNGGYVSVGSWVNPMYTLFAHLTTPRTGKIIVGVISYLVLIFIAWILSRVVPWRAAPGLPAGADPQRDPLTIALRTALVISTAWLVSSMYTLSWYDLIAWAPLAVLAGTRLDSVMVFRGVPLSLAYVPGRAIEFGHALDVTAHRIRDTLSPIAQILVLVMIVLWWRDPERRQLLWWPFPKPRRWTDRPHHEHSTGPDHDTDGLTVTVTDQPSDPVRERSGAGAGPAAGTASVVAPPAHTPPGPAARPPRVPAGPGPDDPAGLPR
ncbi:hypothetical protein FHX74_001452 [Friedmanniella endophytica]|uniref:Alpha-1,6-mannosyltransferase n=1 Tax=Microlunatus kandeliicorticis TaxID=1759536 RepID=A0A7W3IRE2_9ACTN|nr:hypothetical protein [Microlunatus kandeliicorticis]MBA8793847.1 hypothetical protein [Microlunatus kandeliicorticis]